MPTSTPSLSDSLASATTAALADTLPPAPNAAPATAATPADTSAPAATPDTDDPAYQQPDLAALANSAVQEALGTADAADGTVTEATGTDDAPAPEGDDAEGDAAPEVPELPEGFVAPPVMDGGMATEFTLYDDQGAIEVPALMVEYTANGKVRKDRLDIVVRMAQTGVYNQEREDRIKAIESAAAERDELAEMIQQRDQQMERLLSDPDYLARALAAYADEMTPEKEVARARQETADLRVQHELQQIAQHGEAFNATELAPAIEMIVTHLPTVMREELTQRVEMALLAHADTVHGVQVVPPSRYPAIRKYLVEDLAVWAKAVHQARSQRTVSAPASKASKPPAAKDPALTRAQQEAQRAKSVVGRATKPAATPVEGVSTKPPAASKPLPKNATVDDATNAALAEIMAAYRN